MSSLPFAYPVETEKKEKKRANRIRKDGEPDQRFGSRAEHKEKTAKDIMLSLLSMRGTFSDKLHFVVHEMQEKFARVHGRMNTTDTRISELERRVQELEMMNLELRLSRHLF